MKLFKIALLALLASSGMYAMDHDAEEETSNPLASLWNLANEHNEDEGGELPVEVLPEGPTELAIDENPCENYEKPLMLLDGSELGPKPELDKKAPETEPMTAPASPTSEPTFYQRNEGAIKASALLAATVAAIAALNEGHRRLTGAKESKLYELARKAVAQVRRFMNLREQNDSATPR